MALLIGQTVVPYRARIFKMTLFSVFVCVLVKCSKKFVSEGRRSFSKSFLVHIRFDVGQTNNQNDTSPCCSLTDTFLKQKYVLHRLIFVPISFRYCSAAGINVYNVFCESVFSVSIFIRSDKNIHGRADRCGNLWM